MKGFSVFAALGTLAMFGSSLLLAQNNPFIGTWKLNAAKSKYAPGPGPRSSTRTYVAQGTGVKVTVETVAADGSHNSNSYTANYDDKDNPLPGSSTADTIALKRSGNTVKFTLKKGGKVVSTGTNVVSKDGKVMTITQTGTNAGGQLTSTVAVYEKQ